MLTVYGVAVELLALGKAEAEAASAAAAATTTVVAATATVIVVVAAAEAAVSEPPEEAAAAEIMYVYNTARNQIMWTNLYLISFRRTTPHGKAHIPTAQQLSGPVSTEITPSTFFLVGRSELAARWAGDGGGGAPLCTHSNADCWCWC
jgi:hypothetical protein